jgi:chromosome partitioning protein
VKVVTFQNQKGGVGKTSSVFHLGGALGASGLRVLLVDNDPQGSLTQGFFGPAGFERLEPAATVAAVYGAAGAEPDAVTVPAGVPGVFLVPGSAAAKAVNMLPVEDWGQAQWGLRGLTDEVRGRYDLCLIDCPPNLHLCSWAALLASDALVVPLQPEDFGSQGLRPVQESFHAARQVNPGLELAGYLLTMVDKRLAVHQTYERMLRDLYGSLVFANPLPRAKDFVEGVAVRQPVNLYKPRSAAAKAVRAVADELLERVRAREGQGVAA